MHLSYASDGAGLYSFDDEGTRGIWVNRDHEHRWKLSVDAAYDLSQQENLSPVRLKVLAVGGRLMVGLAERP